MKKLCILIVVISIFLLSLSNAFATETEQYQELMYGSKGNAVLALQARLKELGYLNSSADGDFGGKTKGAVFSFQKMHNLTANGIASIEMQGVLFSDSAKAAPEKQPLLVTNVTMVNDYEFTHVVENNLDEAIDSISFKFITFNTSENVITTHKLDDDENLLAGTWSSAYKLSAGRHNTWSTTKDVNRYDYGPLVNKVAVGIESYHTVSGKTVYYNDDQITFYCSDGSIIYPQNEDELIWTKDDGTTNKKEYPDEAYDLAFGITSSVQITWWLSEAYDLPKGQYVIEVEPGSIAEKAGIQPGDVVVHLDGSAVYENTIHKSGFMDAKLALLQGKDVLVEYYRNGKMYTTVYKPYTEETPSEPIDESSFVDELFKLADLYERGFITQEEFEEFKAKLLNQ